MDLRPPGLAALQHRDWLFVCSKLSKTILITKSLCVAYDTERISSLDLISILSCPNCSPTLSCIYLKYESKSLVNFGKYLNKVKCDASWIFLQNKWKIVKIRRLIFSSLIILTWRDKNLDINVSLWVNQTIIFFILNDKTHYTALVCFRHFCSFLKLMFGSKFVLTCSEKKIRSDANPRQFIQTTKGQNNWVIFKTF